MSSSSGPTAWAFRLILSGASLAWMALIFQASSSSPQEVNETLSGVAWLGQYRNVIGHLVLYAVLGSLLQFCSWSWRSSLAWSGRWALAAVTIAVLYGISDEYHQSLVPGRAATVLDVVIDSAGALSAVVAVSILAKLTRQRLNSSE